MRAYDTASQSKESTKSVMSVFADRLIGVFALVILALFALIVGYLNGQDVSFYVNPVLLVFFLCSLVLLMVINARLVGILDRVLQYLRLPKIATKLDEAYQSIHLIIDEPRTLMIAFLVSLLLQVNVILFYYFIGISLDLGVSFLYFSMIVPVAVIVLLVPFSIYGIGIREGIFVYLLTELGVQPKDAIALSWISFGLMLTQGLIGGIIFAFRGVNFNQSHSDRSVSHKPRN